MEDKLRELGFILNKPLKNGLNRVPTKSAPTKKNGWIYLNNNFINYGSWDDSIDANFLHTKAIEGSKVKINTFYNECQRKLDRDRELEAKYLLDQLREEYFTFKKCNAHPYLEHKNCHVDSKLRYDGVQLVIPAYRIDKQLYGYQTIDARGDKYFKYGSLLKDSFFPILKDSKTLSGSNIFLLVEGYATGSSIFQAMNLLSINCAVIVCFSVGNMDNIHKIMSNQFKDKPILTIKDNDSPGYLPVSMGFVVGRYGEDANDVHRFRGIETLKNELAENLKFIRY